jgi:hypothetical protein
MEPVKYVVTCCHGPLTGGEIDDNRPAGGDVVIDSDNSFRVKTAGLHCEGCEQAVKLGRRNLGELIDAINQLHAVIGYETLEGRRVIPLDQLCKLNRALPRRRTRAGR